MEFNRNRDLIETLWNVKLFVALIVVVSLLGFNRDIVECKVFCVRKIITTALDLIETLWNVKMTNTGYVRRACRI